MITLSEARYQAVINFISDRYPDFDQYAAVIPFTLELVNQLDEAELNWFLRRAEADELSHD